MLALFFTANHDLNMDTVTREKRSSIMSSIRSKDTGPELRVRSFLHRQGLRFKLHSKSLPGKPDLVFPKYKTVLFVNGCFWHGHTDRNCKLARLPKSNISFWKDKIERNAKRDKEQQAKLTALGWRVLVIWECEIGHPTCLEDIRLAIVSDFQEISP